MALALILTIAAGIGSNAAVQGFVRGLLRSELPLPEIDRLVSLFGLDANGATGPLSYDDFLALRQRRDLFESLGAGRESQASVVLDQRSTVMSVAAVTSDFAALLNLGVDHGVVVSHRVWRLEFGAIPEIRGEQIRVDGVNTRIAGVAPDWLEGVYRGRAVDIWMALPETALQEIDRGSRSFWVLGRLRHEAPPLADLRLALSANRSGAGAIAVLPYTGLTADAVSGMLRIGMVLRIAAAAVFVIACANVASCSLARASSRSRETAVRVAIGARHGQLARQLLADSVLITIGGAAVGLLLAAWTMRIIPVLFFDQDAEHLVFAPDLAGILWASTARAGITILCAPASSAWFVRRRSEPHSGAWNRRCICRCRRSSYRA